ncbi:MAG: phasin family protein [Polaromonas sp.]
MIYSNDQFAAIQKNSLDVFAGLSQKTFASFEKLVDLNMAAAKAVVAESVSNLQALAGAKDAQAVLALQSGMIQPLAEKSASYSRHLYDIASDTGAEFTKALESTTAESQKTVTAFLESSLKNAPAGSEAAVAVFRSAIDAGNNAVESAQKTAKQAVQMVESKLGAAGKKAE